MSRQWMPIYWGDYAKKTQHLSTIEHGAYLLLISHCWCTGEAIPDDDEIFRRITRTTSKQWKSIKTTIQKLFIMTDSGWCHERVNIELETSRGVSTSQRLKAEKRWKNDKNQENVDADGNAEAMPCARVTTATVTDSMEFIIPTEYKITDRVNLARSDEKSLRAESKKNYRLSFDYSTGQFSGELEAMGEVWAEAYPAVDIAAEIKKAKAWMLSNPKNKKTNIPRFLSAWLAKAQDRASGTMRSAPATFAEQSRKNTETVIEKLRREAQNGQLY